ncbi:hypothetical protein IM543_05805 [Massilia sp. UMI-21]|nr:hypothetical protein IM543_05805 [Massilia sp. UMI-21]
MLQHILANTPVHVWAILAFLIYRGVLASRDRDVTVPRMLVVPVLMLVLALQSIAMQFGVAGVGMLAWAAGIGAAALQRWSFGRSGVAPGPTSPTLRLRGSWAPLVLMVAIFLIKYVLAVLLAIRPAMASNIAFAAGVCGLLGLCNGCFVGQLARDLAAVRRRGAGRPDMPKDGMDRRATALEAHRS